MTKKRVLELSRIYLAEAWSRGWNSCTDKERDPHGRARRDVDELVKRLTQQVHNESARK